MNENTDQNIEQQPTTPTPEASGDQGEKLFTQADLDRIIGERLARERAKAEPSSEDAREADLKAREARLSCREYIAGEGYPADLLELFDIIKKIWLLRENRVTQDSGNLADHL